MVSASSLSTCGWIPSWPVWLSIARPDPLSPRTHLPAAVFPPDPGKSTSKDWGKEGVQYLSIYTVLFSQVSCFIQQGVHIFFSCPFVTFSCSSQGSEMAFPSLSAGSSTWECCGAALFLQCYMAAVLVVIMTCGSAPTSTVGWQQHLLSSLITYMIPQSVCSIKKSSPSVFLSLSL